MRANLVYALLYASGIYGLVIGPPVRRIVTTLVRPLPGIEHVPLLARVVLAFVLFDLLAYSMHRAAHASPLLWRIHRIHHSDPDFGPLTTFRFHVAEIAWRMALQIVPLYLLSITVAMPTSVFAALLAFNILAHSGLRWTFGRVGHAIVSPAYHAVHHRDATPSNFGMFLSIWDRMFGTDGRHGRRR